MNKIFDTKVYECDFCVVGGGLAGTIAALSAARKGLNVVLIQDRPVLGGNSSSEIRMWVRGAKGKYNRETGILSEFEEENIYYNPTLAPTLWDSVLYGKIKENKNITLLLNSSVLDAETDKNKIKSVTAWQLTTYCYHKINAKLFADCSGDSILAQLSGALFKIGREAKSEFNEQIGPEISDSKTMGMSCLLQARETDHPVKFTPPKWANVYKSDDDFAKVYSKENYSTFRDHKIGTSGCNLWWMELGGDSKAILDTENVRDELLKVVFGIWDHIKNYGDHGAENWELEWVGFLPGKRETVRCTGDYTLTQNDIENGGKFDDVIAYGGWPMDDHNPKGIKAIGKDEVPSKMFPAPSPYGIPYRVLYSKNIDNLFFAGRNISATHAAMSSARVMGTCSLLGQAVGNAAAICIDNNIFPRKLNDGYIKSLQQQILNDGIFLPGVKREISDLSKQAKMNLSDADREILFNGVERPRNDEDKNFISINKGDEIHFEFDNSRFIKELRIQFDLDFGHESVSPNMKMTWFAQKLNQGLDFVPVRVAKTIVKHFCVFVDEELVFENKENYVSFVRLSLNLNAKHVCVKFNETWGSDKINIFACDLI
ncbi:MAG: FAD-dependent oxidoreductase [Ruminococcaceae bacterium]|nr:FAD-dependent oxidoreductase [Oscillospiraceae bacterium]